MKSCMDAVIWFITIAILFIIILVSIRALIAQELVAPEVGLEGFTGTYCSTPEALALVATTYRDQGSRESGKQFYYYRSHLNISTDLPSCSLLPMGTQAAFYYQDIMYTIDIPLENSSIRIWKISWKMGGGTAYVISFVKDF